MADHHQAAGRGMWGSGFGNMMRFRTRSESSNHRTDQTRVTQIIKAVDQALEASKSERDGLGRRISDAISVAALLAGNDTDEYVEREMVDSYRLREYEAEIANGRKRLEHLDYAIGQFESLKAELISRFSSVLSTREH